MKRKDTYKRYWHQKKCKTAEEGIGPLERQCIVHLCRKQWEGSRRQIPFKTEMSSRVRVR